MSTNEDRTKLIYSLAFELTIQTQTTITGEVTDFWQDYLHFQDGGRLSVSQPDQKHYRIYAAYPNGLTVTPYADSPRINVSASRPDFEIARDIIRRLLPAARAYWQLCRDAAARKADQQARIEQTVNILSPCFNARYNDDHTQATISHNCARGEIYSDGLINDFRIRSLTAEQAIKIIELLEAKQ